MPKRRTEDAVHVLITDHFIRRHPPTATGMEAMEERHDRQTGAVRPLYPAHLGAGPEDALYLAIAQVRSSADLSVDIKKIEAAIAAARPVAPEPFVALGEALRAAGRSSRALEAYREALARGGREGRIYVAMGELLMQLNRLEEAVRLLEPAERADKQNVDLRNTLAVLYGRQQRFREAAGMLEETIPLHAGEPLTWFNLAVCRQAMGDRGGAEAAYREAIRLRPDFARARLALERLRNR
jgi:tetratricopeptide (TPR) repeat protein